MHYTITFQGDYGKSDHPALVVYSATDGSGVTTAAFAAPAALSIVKESSDQFLVNNPQPQTSSIPYPQLYDSNDPQVAMDATGDFVITWDQVVVDPTGRIADGRFCAAVFADGLREHVADGNGDDVPRPGHALPAVGGLQRAVALTTAPVLSTDTTITATAFALPATTPYEILVGTYNSSGYFVNGEYMIVTRAVVNGNGTTTLTVMRGVGETTPVAQASGAFVYLVTPGPTTLAAGGNGDADDDYADVHHRIPDLRSFHPLHHHGGQRSDARDRRKREDLHRDSRRGRDDGRRAQRERRPEQPGADRQSGGDRVRAADGQPVPRQLLDRPTRSGSPRWPWTPSATSPSPGKRPASR